MGPYISLSILVVLEWRIVRDAWVDVVITRSCEPSSLRDRHLFTPTKPAVKQDPEHQMNRAEPPMRCIPVSEGAVVCKPKGQKTVSEPVQQTHKLIKASKLSCVELVPIRPLIQRIPIEIVQLIAHYCVNAGESPIKLGHVCAYLRTAVIGAKLIWTNIILANQREQSRVTRNNVSLSLGSTHYVIRLTRL